MISKSSWTSKTFRPLSLYLSECKKSVTIVDHSHQDVSLKGANNYLLVTNNFALIQFYPYTLAGSLQGALPGLINPVAFEIHVVNEEVGFEDEEEKANSTQVDLKTSMRQSCNNPKVSLGG